MRFADMGSDEDFVRAIEIDLRKYRHKYNLT